MIPWAVEAELCWRCCNEGTVTAGMLGGFMGPLSPSQCPWELWRDRADGQNLSCPFPMG